MEKSEKESYSISKTESTSYFDFWNPSLHKILSSGQLKHLTWKFSWNINFKCINITTVSIKKTRSTRMIWSMDLRQKDKCRNICWRKQLFLNSQSWTVSRINWTWWWKLVGKRIKFNVKRCWMHWNNTCSFIRSIMRNRVIKLNSAFLSKGSRIKLRSVLRLKSSFQTLRKNDTIS